MRKTYMLFSPICKYSALKMTCNKKSGTSGMLNHISMSCPEIVATDRNSVVETVDLVLTVFDSERSQRIMSKYRIHVDVPFGKFDNPYFEEWMESMQSAFKVLGRQTVHNDSLIAYEEMKEQLHLNFQGLGSHICPTSHVWTFKKWWHMSTTYHCIDASFILWKKPTSFKDVKYLHTHVANEVTHSRCLGELGYSHKNTSLWAIGAERNMQDMLPEEPRRERDM